MNRETLAILDSIARDRNIDRELLIHDLEQAMVSAARKHFNSLDTEEFGCEIDRLSGGITLWRELEEGGREAIDLKTLGRIPAQTAKQVMIQKFREDERNSLLEEFGKRLYSNCMSCHQANGRGPPPVYPPLRNSEIVHGDPEVLVKILLHGLEGRIEVDGQTYNQVMPAAPVKSDEEIAAVLTYVNQSFGNNLPPVKEELVKQVRAETESRNAFYMVDEILKEHPLKKGK